MIHYHEWLNSWRYYCSIASEFENTIQYVDDAVGDDGKLSNGNTFSNEFYKILFRAASEFENVGKMICSDIDGKNCEKYNMPSISKCILGKYPKITSTQLYTPNEISLKPLNNWITKEQGGSLSIEGIEWWKAYNSLKHGRYMNIEKANFQNCFNAISSLLVMELYAGRMTLNEAFKFEISTNISKYFKYDYYRDLIFPHPQKLPDESLFEMMNKT